MIAPSPDKPRSIDWQEARSRLALAAAGIERANRPPAKAVEEMLASRARELARPPQCEPRTTEPPNVVAFTLGAERYGIEMQWIREVVGCSDLARVPGAPAFIAGIINYRGEIVAVVDLRQLFGIASRGLVDMSRVIVVGNERVEFGILASRALEVAAVWPEELSRTPSDSVAGIGAELVKGVARDGLVVLDGQKLLSDSRLFVNEGKSGGI